jgi:hypothetical protein
MTQREVQVMDSLLTHWSAGQPEVTTYPQILFTDQMNTLCLGYLGCYLGDGGEYSLILIDSSHPDPEWILAHELCHHIFHLIVEGGDPVHEDADTWGRDPTWRPGMRENSVIMEALGRVQ